MQDNQEKCKELAIRIYNLDEEVYKCVGSSLGRTFTGQKETTLRHLAALMYTKPDGHLLRSELALISNMARTIRDKSERRRLMIEYDSILKEIESLPDTFGQTDIVDKERISLNNLIARRQNEISENDHLIICISRTQGSGGNDIGFELADQLQINYYDAEIFDQVMAASALQLRFNIPVTSSTVIFSKWPAIPYPAAFTSTLIDGACLSRRFL